MKITHQRRILTVTLLIAAVGALVWFLIRPDPEPTYQGKPLSYWLDGFVSGNPSPDKATEAVRQIGTNAIPTLLCLLRAEDSKFKLKLIQLSQKQHVINIKLKYAGTRQKEGFYGLLALGALAKSAVPALLEIYNEHRTGTYDNFLETAALIANMGPAAADAVPRFVKATTDTNFQDRFNAVLTLSRIRARPDLSVPALTASLRDPHETVRGTAALCLVDFGTNARSAIPEMTRLLADPDPDVRQDVAEAIKKIDPEAAATAGVK